MAIKYIVEFKIERMFSPDDEITLRKVRYLIDEVIPDDDYGDNLRKYAVENLIKKRDFTKKTECLCVFAKFWDIDDDPDDPLADPVSEIHAYIYREDLNQNPG